MTQRRGGPTQVEATRTSAEDFDELFRAEYRQLCAETALILGDRDAAADVVQDAFEQAFTRWARVRRYDRPGAWVRRVAVREAVRRVRRETRRGPIERTWGARRPEDASSGSAQRLAVLAAVGALPPQQRAAVVLHYFADLSVAEVGAAIGCSASTAKVHLHKARQRLGIVLADAEVTPAEDRPDGAQRGVAPDGEASPDSDGVIHALGRAEVERGPRPSGADEEVDHA